MDNVDKTVNNMNIYQKLQKSRVDLQSKELTKTGHNKHSNYYYFELGDFLPEINEIFFENKLMSLVNFGETEATLTIIDSEKPEDRIIFNSPTVAVKIPSAQEIQNLGAMQTYQRRYLYVTALEIAENDIVDQQPKIDSKQPNKSTHTNTSTTNKKPTEQSQTTNKTPSPEQLVSLGKKAEKLGITPDEMSSMLTFKFGNEKLTMQSFSNVFNHLEEYYKEYLESK